MSEGINFVDYATLAVTGTALGLSSASPALAAAAAVQGAILTFETNQCRWRADGDAPTTTEGHLMDVGDVLQFKEGDWTSVLRAIQFIAVTGTCNIKISYLGRR